mgnify:CR=1 FL=1
MLERERERERLNTGVYLAIRILVFINRVRPTLVFGNVVIFKYIL